MRTKEFLTRLDHDRIVASIRNAEAKTSGQIRVYIKRGEFNGDPLLEAQSQFQRLKMEKTSERNGVLIFVMPRAQKFAVIGDEGIHQKCGNEFWDRVVASMRAHFKSANFTEALVEAIEEAGKALALHFPSKGAPQNELPDDVVEG
jgi:uncharacterized membrane protein